MNSYFKAILILLIPICLILIYSLIDFNINIYSIELQKVNSRIFVEGLKEKYISTKKGNVEIGGINDTIQRESTITLDTSKQRILLVGDSMIEHLHKRLADYANENNHDLHSVIWYSSTTKLWATTDTLNHFIKKFNPSFVLICIGGNEQFLKNANANAPYIDSIVNRISKIKYAWVGTPNWTCGTGINDIIEKKVGPHRYYNSSKLKLERASDGRHPSIKGASEWMDSLAIWLTSDYAAPINLRRPSGSKQKIRKQALTILQPLN